MDSKENWTEVISAKHSWLHINFSELWRYRDLIIMFVKRDFVTFYKQTILGPLWFIIQPLLSTLMFYYVFVVMAETQASENMEQKLRAFLVILSGQVIWSYFSDSLNKVSTVFTTNQHIFGKVFFPRIIMPISITTSGLMKLGIQLVLFLLFYFYAFFSLEGINPTLWILATPLLILLMAIFALGVGMIFSSLTTKYRDLSFLLTFGIQLYMYVSPVVYPMETFKGVLKTVAEYNPISSIFICFREGFIGDQNFEPLSLVYSTISIFIIFIIGVIFFNKVEKTFMDTV